MQKLLLFTDVMFINKMLRELAEKDELIYMETKSKHFATLKQYVN